MAASNCDGTSSSMEATDNKSECEIVSKPANYAVIPYNNTTGVLSQFYKAKKVYKISATQKNIVIKQDWTNNGVAGVVWEAVSTQLFSVRVVKMRWSSSNAFASGIGLGFIFGAGQTGHKCCHCLATTTFPKELMGFLQSNTDQWLKNQSVVEWIKRLLLNWLTRVRFPVGSNQRLKKLVFTVPCLKFSN